jgi:hypothetical protein
VAIGDQILQKRPDLGLLQPEVAEIIGVTEPKQHYNPRIIKFLQSSLKLPVVSNFSVAWESPVPLLQGGKRFFDMVSPQSFYVIRIVSTVVCIYDG